MVVRKRGTVVDLRGRLGAAALLDELLDQFGYGDLAPVTVLLERGLRDFGPEELVGELSRRLLHLGAGADATAICWALEQIGGKTVSVQMREIVTADNVPTRVRTDAALVLNALGEPIDPQLEEDEPGDLEAILQKILDETERKLVNIDVVERAFVLDEMFDEIGRQIEPEQDGGVLITLVEALSEQSRVVAADMLWVLREFSGDEEIRGAAAHGLAAMRWRDVTPTPEMVAATYEGRFVQASVSAGHRSADQTQLLLSWEQRPGHLLLISFLIDTAFWGGGVKDFFLKPSAGAGEFSAIIDVYRRQGVAMLPIDAADARSRVEAALAANAEQSRPIPIEYRRFHNLIVHTLFQSNQAVELPSLQRESESPLGRAAAEVEHLLRDLMPLSGFTSQQTQNGRMLWRDYFLNRTPRVGKTAVWAAAITYLIGWIEDRDDLTQARVASQYSVATGSVSRRATEIRNGFLEVEQGIVAYATDGARDGRVRDAIERIVDLPVRPIDSTREQVRTLNTDYDHYMAERTLLAQPPRQLDRTEFDQYLGEMDILVAMEQQQILTTGQSQRLEELRHLLLLDR